MRLEPPGGELRGGCEGWQDDWPASGEMSWLLLERNNLARSGRSLKIWMCRRFERLSDSRRKSGWRFVRVIDFMMNEGSWYERLGGDGTDQGEGQAEDTRPLSKPEPLGGEVALLGTFP